MFKNILLTCIILYLLSFPLDTLTKSLRNKRNALVNKNRLWPNKTVYYKINNKHFNATQREVIKLAILELNKLSCVQILPVQNENQHHINIIGNRKGCWANVGYGTNQNLNLAKGCITSGVIQHELLHAIGFHHMHSTHNRDEYVKIVWDNIPEIEEHNFEKYSKAVVTNFGIPYDYGSIMHYKENSFGIDGKITIIALKPTNGTMGQRKGLSKRDIKKLNKLYKCPSY